MIQKTAAPFKNLSPFVKDTYAIDTLEQSLQESLPEAETLKRIAQEHPMRITPYYLNLIDWNNPADPIRKMAIPFLGEQQHTGMFDTSGEHENTKFRGVQHKYRQTVLILTTNTCAMYCRHCFRKRLVGIAEDEIVEDWEAAIAYVREQKDVTNVLLTGGDALMLSTEFLEVILQKLSTITHLKFVRIGTRLPVVLPERIIDDTALHEVFRTFSSSGKQLYVTTQYNHPHEITTQSKQALDLLKEHSVIVNNQTVLLRGVNDTPDIMTDLQATLAGIGVIPYYIFQCRPVATVMDSFQVPLYEACQIVDETRTRLDGLSKRFKFVLSHKTGKLEILGWNDGGVYVKYHQAKEPSLHNTLFHKKLKKIDGWIEL